MSSEASEPVVKVEKLSQRYGKAVALADVDLEIPANKMIGLIGPDGVGKSTLLGIIAGVRKMQGGKATVLGGNIDDAKIRTAVSSRIAYLPQGLGKNLYPTLSIFENADFFGRLFGQSREEREQRITELFTSTDLISFRDRPAGKLSGGMKQKLGLCCSLIHEQHRPSFCFMPPESLPAGRSRNEIKSVLVNNSVMRCSRSSRDWPKRRPKKSAFSNIESVG